MGGRNLGLLHAKGDVVAFIDNDAYASRTWLAEAVGTLHSDPSIGAVASLVFFDKHKIILNGAGGTLNYQGYGGDLCFNARLSLPIYRTTFSIQWAAAWSSGEPSWIRSERWTKS